VLTGAVDAMAAILFDVVFKDLEASVKFWYTGAPTKKRVVAWSSYGQGAEFWSSPEAKRTTRAGPTHARQHRYRNSVQLG